MGGHERKTWGPVPTQFYPAFNDLESRGIVSKDAETHVVSTIKPQKVTWLNEEEIACLDKTLDEFGDLSIHRVKKIAYKTEPMVQMQAQERASGGAKLIDREMDFSTISRHPLFDADDVDLSFLEDPEFKKTLD
jgi:uncharacterized phage-associated protein